MIRFINEINMNVAGITNPVILQSNGLLLTCDSLLIPSQLPVEMNIVFESNGIQTRETLRFLMSRQFSYFCPQRIFSVSFNRTLLTVAQLAIYTIDLTDQVSIV